jgi:general secretion pathway protein G
LELYYLDVGSYPSSEQGLQALLSAPVGAAGWHGPYLKNESGLLDPWHKRYAYRMPGRNGEFDVYAQGHEGDVASSHGTRPVDDQS